ncbi:hypothetical protein QWJ34_16290 [Saccharibacillus sp. CPCC 101409]|uniref:hypothetical protein n=1 Tax=Saccharibacillus sp. CPCC 101409 TaxID=3058041 RepID=UPI002670F539|nr:hypothetical protein [Saccharibacillus sp. CPCC 101409]MDO3411326.1 hypothetical protein [Saccharibacillus sp. CPCC 101409]
MRITGENLDETIEANERISKTVASHIAYIEQRIIKWTSLSVEQQALEILKEYHLIEVPIPDENLGGAIRQFGDGKAVPIINTAQPRVYQYFIYWHEVFHLTEYAEMNEPKKSNYEISTEFDLNERKADYFASQMLFRNSDLYDYYLSLKHSDFFVKIAHCIKSFKAPYKAILIELYQLARRNRNHLLQIEVKSFFDQRLTINEWSALFQEHALDDTLIKPSLVVNLSSIKNAIMKSIDKHPDVDMYKDNLEVILHWENKYKAVRAQMKERYDERL